MQTEMPLLLRRYMERSIERVKMLLSCMKYVQLDDVNGRIIGLHLDQYNPGYIFLILVSKQYVMNINHLTLLSSVSVPRSGPRFHF